MCHGEFAKSKKKSVVISSSKSLSSWDIPQGERAMAYSDNAEDMGMCYSCCKCTKCHGMKPDDKSVVWFPLNPGTHEPLGPPLMQSVGVFKCDNTNSYITNYDWKLWVKCKNQIVDPFLKAELEFGDY